MVAFNRLSYSLYGARYMHDRIRYTHIPKTGRRIMRRYTIVFSRSSVSRSVRLERVGTGAICFICRIILSIRDCDKYYEILNAIICYNFYN